MALSAPQVGQTYALRADLGDDEHALPAGTALKVVAIVPPGTAGVELSADPVVVFEPAAPYDRITEGLHRRVALNASRVPHTLSILQEHADG